MMLTEVMVMGFVSYGNNGTNDNYRVGVNVYGDDDDDNEGSMMTV